MATPSYNHEIGQWINTETGFPVYGYTGAPAYPTSQSPLVYASSTPTTHATINGLSIPESTKYGGDPKSIWNKIGDQAIYNTLVRAGYTPEQIAQIDKVKFEHRDSGSIGDFFGDMLRSPAMIPFGMMAGFAAPALFGAGAAGGAGAGAGAAEGAGFGVAGIGAEEAASLAAAGFSPAEIAALGQGAVSAGITAPAAGGAWNMAATGLDAGLGQAGGTLSGQSSLPGSITGAADPIEALWHATEFTGMDSATAAANALGFDSTNAMLSAINPDWIGAVTPENWLADMGPVEGQAGTPVNTDMPFKAQIAEAGTMSQEGLTAAEMGQLGVDPWAANIGSMMPNQMTTSGAWDTASKLGLGKNALDAIGALGAFAARPKPVSLPGRGTVGPGSDTYNDNVAREFDTNPNEYFNDSFQTSVRFGKQDTKPQAQGVDAIRSFSAGPSAAAGAARPGRSVARINTGGIPTYRPGSGY